MLPLLALLAPIVASVGSAIVGNAGASDRQNQMNAYNSPAAQMARYSAAGLNPNLIYGSGGSAGNQASPAAFFTPDVDPVKIWSSYVASKESRSRQELNRARTDAETYKLMYDNLKREAESKYYDVNASYQTGIMKHTIHKLAAQTRAIDETIPNILRDGKIKDAVLSDKLYTNRFNQSLRDYGVNANDHPLLRMGALLFKKNVPHFNLKLNH